MDSRFKDLTGQTFGKLIVIGFAGWQKIHSKWDTECIQCGDKSTRLATNLKKGYAENCIICRKLGLAGKTFGKWKVLSFSHRSGTRYFWNCQCECGRHKKVTKNHLQSGASTNCGCENIEQISKLAKESVDKARATRRANGYEWTPDDPRYLEFKRYQRKVYYWTRKHDLSHWENSDKRGNGPGLYHLDHKYSIRQGFEDEIPPRIIGSLPNLEFIPSLDNITKGTKCSISKEELYNLFRLQDGK